MDVPEGILSGSAPRDWRVGKIPWLFLGIHPRAPLGLGLCSKDVIIPWDSSQSSSGIGVVLQGSPWHQLGIPSRKRAPSWCWKQILGAALPKSRKNKSSRGWNASRGNCECLGMAGNSQEFLGNGQKSKL